MKITKRQLRRIIRESLSDNPAPESFALTAAEEAAKINKQVPGAAYSTNQSDHERYGIKTGYDLALSIYNQQYSDLYKSVHGIRPKLTRGFESIKKAELELDRLSDEAERKWKSEQEWETKQKELEDQEALIKSLMPTSRDEENFDKLSKQSGMGRRLESVMREERLADQEDKLSSYNPAAVAAAKHAIEIVPYPQGGIIENEIHSYLNNSLGLDPHGDEIFTIADEALSVAGIMLGVGPNAL
jgi:hypothetical protein